MGFDREHDDVGAEAALIRLLRREAARDRPAFAPDLQARIVAAVADTGRGRGRRVSPRAACLVTVCCAILGVGGLWLTTGPAAPPKQPAMVVAAADDAVEPLPIDQVPLLDEIGTELLAKTAAIAAEAVGLPRWDDLVDAGAAFAAPVDGWPATAAP
jgi:hypothetical protein